MSGTEDRDAAKEAVRARIAASRGVWRDLWSPGGTRRERPSPSPRPREHDRGPAASSEPTAATGSPSQAAAAFDDEAGPDDRSFPRSHTMRWLSTHPAGAALAGVAIGLLLVSGAPRRAASWVRPAASMAEGAAARTAGTLRQLREMLAWVRPLLPVLAALLAARSQAGAVRGGDASAPGGGRVPPP